jgi:hypothetical protein
MVLMFMDLTDGDIQGGFIREGMIFTDLTKEVLAVSL